MLVRAGTGTGTIVLVLGLVLTGTTTGTRYREAHGKEMSCRGCVHPCPSNIPVPLVDVHVDVYLNCIIISNF